MVELLNDRMIELLNKGWRKKQQFNNSTIQSFYH